MLGTRQKSYETKARTPPVPDLAPQPPVLPSIASKHLETIVTGACETLVGSYWPSISGRQLPRQSGSHLGHTDFWRRLIFDPCHWLNLLTLKICATRFLRIEAQCPVSRGQRKLVEADLLLRLDGRYISSSASPRVFCHPLTYAFAIPPDSQSCRLSNVAGDTWPAYFPSLVTRSLCHDLQFPSVAIRDKPRQHISTSLSSTSTSMYINVCELKNRASYRF